MRATIRGIPLVASALVTLICAWPLARAESVPVRGQLDARIRTVAYDADQVYRLYGWVGYSIELVFEDGEVFAGHGGGDLDGITFGAHENQLIVKPQAGGVATNFVVYTNRRAYRFDYTVSARRPDPAVDEVMYVVRFVYPAAPGGLPGSTSAEQVSQRLADARSARASNRDYWFCGHRSLKPIAASDDGVHTRLTFAGKAEWPAVFVRNEDASESLLNFSVDGTDLVIHRVAPAFVLRRGRLTGCVVNKGYDGSGEQLKSGTVAPSVVRERKGAQP